jgi:hypothetical protein
MYWVQHDDEDTMRIFSWSDQQQTPKQRTRQVQPSNFDNPDCRGGVDNTDYIERNTGWDILGFTHRCAVANGTNQRTGVLACYWNSAAVRGIPQGHIRSAVFSLSNLALTGQPHIWNANACFGFPTVSANVKGNLGVSLAAGGRKGGGGSGA